MNLASEFHNLTPIKTRRRRRQEPQVIERTPRAKVSCSRTMKYSTNQIIVHSLTVSYLLTLYLALFVNCIYQNESISASTAFDSDSTSISVPSNPETTGEGGLVFSNPSLIKPNDSPENKLDIVQKARNNEFSAEMITNKTRAMVSCETGEILVKINFTEPFRGIGYADYDRSSPCKFFGDGGQYYETRLPLRGCGTKQEAPRLFVNHLVLRFHRSLELEEDEVKTIVCRYPPPLAPAPPPAPGLPAKIINLPPEPAKLTQYEPFVIIAGLLFFALLLAGIGTTSYMTRKQVIQPINTPLPITAQTDYDTYVDNQTIVTVEDLQTTQKFVPFPKLTTHTVDDIFITNLHEIETEENLTHRRHQIPRPHLEAYDYDDTYLTNQDEIITEDLIEQRAIKAANRNLNRQDCDDTYITNQDEDVDEETLIHYKMKHQPSKIELRTIEDTFITKVYEVVENQETVHHKDHLDCEEYEHSYSNYSSRRDY